MLYPLLKTLLLPPAGNLVLLLIGWLIGRRWRTLGQLLCICAFISLWLMASPKGALWLASSLETPPPSSAELQQAEAMVVLGNGKYLAAPEYSGDDLPSLPAQQRLIYAAELHRQTGLPILTTGGYSSQQNQSEAQLMARFLKEQLNTPTWKTENASRTTYENALFSAELLQQAGIKRVLLVSQVWHLPRARYVFEQQGLTVYSAGTGYYRPRPLRFNGQYWLPEPEALQASYWAVHEWLGILWYRLKTLL